MSHAEYRSDLIPPLGAQIFVNNPIHRSTVPLHDHTYHEIAIVADGTSTHRTIHGDTALSRGNVIVIFPGEWHGYINCSNFRIFNLCIAQSLIASELGWTGSDPQLSHILSPSRNNHDRPPPHLHLGENDLEVICAALTRIIDLSKNTDPIRVHLEVIGHAIVVLGLLSYHAPCIHKDSSRDEPIRNLLAHLNDNLAHDWSLYEMATIVGCSREHLCRRFRALYNTSPLIWLARRRAEFAARLLLSSDASIAEIGKHVGWGNPNFFSRRFRAVLGRSPSNFRKFHKSI